jgi:hypothetical protein
LRNCTITCFSILALARSRSVRTLCISAVVNVRSFHPFQAWPPPQYVFAQRPLVLQNISPIGRRQTILVEGIQRADCGSNLQRAVDMAGQHLFSELASSAANLRCTTGWAGMARWKLGGIGVFRLACARLRVCAFARVTYLRFLAMVTGERSRLHSWLWYGHRVRAFLTERDKV